MECPLTELREMYKKVKRAGRIVIGIKNEGVQYLREWKPNDIDNHLYTWNDMLLGNMVRAAGFNITRIEPPLAKREARAAQWTKTSYSTPDGFIYLWVHGVKR